MRLDKALKILAEDSLLASMPEALPPKLSAAAKVRAVPRGTALTRQGQHADTLYIPIDGPLRLVTRTETGSTTAQLSARRALNLGAVLNDHTWSYSAFADVDVHVLQIDGETFRQALASVPAYARYLQRITSLRSFREAAAALRRVGVPPRTVQRLLSALDEHTVADGEIVSSARVPRWLIVDTGSVALARVESGDSHPLTTLVPAEYYGGTTALGGGGGLEITALERTTVYAIGAERLAGICAGDAELVRALRLEHPDVQRRVRRAFTESGEAFSEVLFGSAAAAFADAVSAEPTESSLTSLAVAEQTLVLPRSARPLGKAWSPPAARARRLDGVRCAEAEDTGAAALVSLLKFHERPVSLGQVRRALSHRAPPSLLDLAELAERQGFMTHAAKLATPRDMRQLQTPFLLVIGHHYVVVHEVRSRCVRVFDPTVGLREYSMRELATGWSGAALQLRDMRPFMRDLAPAREPESPSEATRDAPNKSAVKSRRSTYLRLFGDVRGALVAAIIVATAVLILSVVTPKLNGLVIDQVLVYGDLDLLAIVALGLVLVHVSTFALSGFRDLCVAYLGGVIEHRLSSIALRHTLAVSLDAHGEDRVGTALSRLDELNRVRASLSSDVVQILLQIAQAAVYLALVFSYSLELGLVVVAAVPVSALIIRVAGRRYRQRYLQLFDESSRMQSQTTEQVEQVATIKALGGAVSAQRRWEKTLVDKVGIERGLGRLRVLMGTSLKLVEDAVKIVGMYLGVKLVLGGDITPGALVAVTQYVVGALGPLMGLAGKLDELEQVGISLRKLDELFQHPLEEDEQAGVRSDVTLEGGITARDLTFAYPDGPPVVRGLSFEIEPGQTVAIVGRSGSGKTTLAKLLHGALRPTSGELIFDEQDSRGLPLPAIRRSVGIVLQESQLFAGSILENIAYGDDRPDVRRVREAARLAAAHDFISAFPKQYETYLAEGGLGLSGGQRQRICIARALYRSPRILVMDEATSALDAESERAIMANMRDILRGRTGIVIAHRLNTVKHADRILVIDHGELVESGTHDELVAMRGLYHALFGQQFHQG